MSTAAATLAAAVERQAAGLRALSCSIRQHLEDRQMLPGIVTHGGVAPNIVPASTSALYYLRAPDVESLPQLGTRVRACFEAGALATGWAHEVTQASPVYPDLGPDPWLATPSADRAVCDGALALALTGLVATDDAQRDRLISRAPGAT